MEFILPLAAIVLIVAFVGYVRRGQQKTNCPECGSTQLRIVDKQLKELKQDTTRGYSVKLDVSLILETRYRCQVCNHTWLVTAPEN